MRKIVVSRRHADYHACYEGLPAVWGCGPTPSAAIGDLIQSHPEYSYVTVHHNPPFHADGIAVGEGKMRDG